MPVAAELSSFVGAIMRGSAASICCCLAAASALGVVDVCRLHGAMK